MPSARGPRFTSVSLAAAIMLCLLALVILSHGPWAPVWRMVVLVMGAHVPYFALVFLAHRRRLDPGPYWIVATALALRLLCAAGQPVFSDDVYRYVWDGKVSLSGRDPYAQAPDSPTLSHLRDADWDKINNPGLRTPYPPVAQGFFALICAASPSPLAFKLASAILDTGVVVLLILLGGATFRRRAPPDAKEKPLRPGLALPGLIYGLNPLICVETGLAGHVEPLALFLLLLAVFFALRAQRNRLAAGLIPGVILGISVCAKFIPALLGPAMGRGRRILIPIALLVTAGLIIPFTLSSGAGLFESGDAMLRRWEGNASLFELFRSSSEFTIGKLSSATHPEDLVHLPLLDGIAMGLEDTFFSLHKDGVIDPNRPGAFPLMDLSLATSKILTGLCLLLVILGCLIKKLGPLRSGLWIFGALTLLSPVLHPWYMLWVLAFASLERTWPWLVLGFAVPLSYLTLDGWWEHSMWVAPTWVPILEYGLFAIAACANLLISQKKLERHDKTG